MNPSTLRSLSIVLVSSVWACSPADDLPGPSGGSSGTSGAGGGVTGGGGSGPTGGQVNPPGGAGNGSGGQQVAGAGGAQGGAGASFGGSSGSGGAAGVTFGGMSGGGGASGASGGGSGGGAPAGGSGGTGGAMGCATSGFKICEDFESAAPGTAAPQGWSGKGSFNIVEDQFHRGRRAMRLNAAPSGFRGLTRNLQALAAFGGTHWGRLFYKVQTPAPRLNGNLHSTLVALNAMGPLNRRVDVRVVDTVQNSAGKHQYLYNVQPPCGTCEFGKGSDYDYVFEDVWHCTEWRVDAATQSYRFYLDGTEIPRMAINNGAGNFTNSEIPTTVDTLAIGWNNYQATTGTGFVAWIDDIALDVERVTCAR